MNIIAHLVCFLFIFINTVSCRANGHVLPEPGTRISGSVPVKASSFFSGKKDRLEEQNPVMHPFLTVSTLSFMLGPGTTALYSLSASFYNRYETKNYCAIQAWGIVAGLKAKMLFPVHYFW